MKSRRVERKTVNGEKTVGAGKATLESTDLFFIAVRPPKVLPVGSLCRYVGAKPKDISVVNGWVGDPEAF